MRLGLHVPDLEWPTGPAKTGENLAEIARTADDAGFASISVMDHFFSLVGGPDHAMLEAYTTLGFIAAATKRAQLLTLVTGVTYRPPGILAKQIATLDVLSGGRAALGIGAAWFQREHVALGVPFPSVRERFERLEEALQIALQMWSADNGPYTGTHYQLAETMNIPQVVSKPRPPIMIGGSGKPKTLRLTARYGDAYNVVGGDAGTVGEVYAALSAICEQEGRPYEEIERTAGMRVDLGRNGENVGATLEQMARYADAGIQRLICSVADVSTLRPIEILARDVIPQAAKL